MILEEDKSKIKETIKDNQILIRKAMLTHKNVVKKEQTKIKKDRKTIDLYKEKIAKLSLEKERLEALESNSSGKGMSKEFDNMDIQSLKTEIFKEIAEREEYENKIKEIKEEFNVIKHEMGGLNATQQNQERYEKHIKILENRLDKANQKFNESIEKDKILREQIDKLRKERFIFEK
jgi:hypothetical protein